MTCPRCYGKGFVDLNDIKRLGMEKEWKQGFCRYCEGEGEVEKGKTKILNPLGPVWHESDIL
jgi:DnaJ-class molecular chaperone